MKLPKDSLIAICLPSLGGGGAERAMLLLAKGLVDLGLRVDLVLSNAEGELKNEIPTSVNVIDFKATRVSGTIPSLISYLRKSRPAIIYSTPNHLNVVVLIAKLLAFVKTKVIVREANVPISSLKRNNNLSSKAICKLIPLLYPFAQKIIAVSEDVKDELIILNPKLRDKISVTVSPVVSDEFFKKSAAEINDPWFTAEDSPIVVGMGRLHPQKDFSTLIKAFAEVKKTRAVKLAIFGEGKERPKLEELIRELNIVEDVRLMGFVVNPFPYLKCSNVFVLSSLYEGMPNVLVQAMALDLPVVATNCKGGMQEALNCGKFGITVPIGDYKEMAKAINASLNLPRQLEQGEYARDRFNLTRVVQEYIQTALN